jgi:hypothetical protein
MVVLSRWKRLAVPTILLFSYSPIPKKHEGPTVSRA